MSEHDCAWCGIIHTSSKYVWLLLALLFQHYSREREEEDERSAWTSERLRKGQLCYCLDNMSFIWIDSDDSKPQACPIQPPFILTDLITDDSVCSQSISSSYINQCAHDYQIHLHLSPCLPSQTILGLSIKSSHTHILPSYSIQIFNWFVWVHGKKIFTLISLLELFLLLLHINQTINMHVL